MKIAPIPAALPIVAAIIASLANGVESIDSNCWTNEDTQFDFYPTKVSVEHSKYWSIEYSNRYKIVRNLHIDETYLLYQCGTEPPTDLGIAFNQTIEIPVKYVGIDQTPTVAFLEYLGLVENIVSYMSDVAFVSSPCLKDAIESGTILVVQSEEDVITAPNQEQVNETLAIVSAFTTDLLYSNSVKFSEYKELTNAGIFEWIKFVSVFFNEEAKANEVFDASQDRWDCVTENAQRFSADTPIEQQPSVLWVGYSDYCKGWSIGECPNYYCEYAKQCSANFLTTTEEGVYSEECFTNYFTLDQVLAIGQDADVWVYTQTDSDWDTTYAAFQNELDTMKAVQKKKVYDLQASGMNAWFEQRYAEYFVVLQDFCSIVGTTRSFSGNKWLRNVFSDKIGDLGQCTSNSRSNTILSEQSTCENLSPITFGDGKSSVNALSLGYAVVAVTVFGLLMF